MTEQPPTQPPSPPPAPPSPSDAVLPSDTLAMPWGHPPAPAPVTDGSAVLALVMSVLSWVLLPVVLAIVALVLAGRADRQIRASGGARSGDGLVTAARWVAWINLLLAAMVVAFVAAFVVALTIAG